MQIKLNDWLKQNLKPTDEDTEVWLGSTQIIRHPKGWALYYCGTRIAAYDKPQSKLYFYKIKYSSSTSRRHHVVAKLFDIPKKFLRKIDKDSTACIWLEPLHGQLKASSRTAAGDDIKDKAWSIELQPEDESKTALYVHAIDSNQQA